VGRITAQPRAGEYLAPVGIVRVNIIPNIGSKRLDRLTPTDVESLMASIIERGASVLTARHVRVVLATALNKAVRDGLVARNVASLADVPYYEPPEIPVLTPEAATAIRAAMRGHELEGLIAIALSTGARSGELLALRWSDVDSDKRTLTIQRTLQRDAEGKLTFMAPKTKSSRRQIALDERDVQVLRDHRQAQTIASIDGLVFCDQQGRPLDASNVTRAFQRGLRRAGLPGMRFHDLRHGSATLALAAGVHPKVVQERLGHANIGITLSRYSHVIPSLHDEAASRIASLVYG
jgi:integrase